MNIVVGAIWGIFFLIGTYVIADWLESAFDWNFILCATIGIVFCSGVSIAAIESWKVIMGGIK